MTAFDDWLRQLAAAGKGPATLYVERGNAYSLGITLDAVYAASSLAGKVRLAPDAAGTIATFTCSAPTIDAGQTIFTATLASGTSWPADTAGDGHVDLAFDFELTPSGGNAELLFGGTLVVLGSVTQ